MQTSPHKIRITAAAIFVLGVFVACDGEDTQAPPTTGALQVAVTTTGDAPDPDGYNLTVGGESRAISADETVTFDDLAAGGHEVELSGLAANCSVAGENPRTVSVQAEETATTAFAVDCPATALEVTVTTTGDVPDPDGYNLTVGCESRAVSVDEIVTFDDLDAGAHEVELADIAANCSVAGENPRTVSVQAGETATTTFAVDCPATVLEVTVATTGDVPDPDGYRLLLGSSEQTIAVDQTVVFSDLDGGVYTLELRDVAYNCTVAGENPRDVQVDAGTTEATTFEVTCTVPLADVDGEMAPGEWDGATVVAAFAGATFYYMNDGLNLYLALEVDDPTLGANDVFAIRFDNERNGVFDANEDEVAVTGAGVFSDRHSSATNWAIGDDRRHGAGAAGATGGMNVFEMVHPLNSGDAQDFALVAPTTVGYCIVYTKDGVGSSATSFPAGCQGAGNDLSGYAELIIQ